MTTFHDRLRRLGWPPEDLPPKPPMTDTHETPDHAEDEQRLALVATVMLDLAQHSYGGDLRSLEAPSRIGTWAGSLAFLLRLLNEARAEVADLRERLNAADAAAKRVRDILGDPRVGVHLPPADWGLPRG